ncbi:MAG: hypothetical protein PHY16_13335 [Methylobacter sp.]|nr:hypothetical protein [Methylobacter sp.]
MSKPDATMHKLMNVGRLNRLGWTAEAVLLEGIVLAYSSYQQR